MYEKTLTHLGNSIVFIPLSGMSLNFQDEKLQLVIKGGCKTMRLGEGWLESCSDIWSLGTEPPQFILMVAPTFMPRVVRKVSTQRECLCCFHAT